MVILYCRQNRTNSLTSTSAAPPPLALFFISHDTADELSHSTEMILLFKCGAHTITKYMTAKYSSTLMDTPRDTKIASSRCVRRMAPVPGRRARRRPR